MRCPVTSLCVESRFVHLDLMCRFGRGTHQYQILKNIISSTSHSFNHLWLKKHFGAEKGNLCKVGEQDVEVYPQISQFSASIVISAPSEACRYLGRRP